MQKNLNLILNLPILEIIEIKKNKSFVAKKAKIYNEEKKYLQKHQLHQFKFQIFQKIKLKLKKKIDKIYINIATFYSINTAKFLKERIIKEIKILIKKIKN